MSGGGLAIARPGAATETWSPIEGGSIQGFEVFTSPRGEFPRYGCCDCDDYIEYQATLCGSTDDLVAALAPMASISRLDLAASLAPLLPDVKGLMGEDLIRWLSQYATEESAALATMIVWGLERGKASG